MEDEIPEGETRGRPRQLTKRSIVQAAARIRPEEFSLSKLADVLGVSSQSLYHYFPSIKSIKDAIADEIAQKIPMIDTGLPWRAYVSEMILQYRSWLNQNDYPIARNAVYDGIAIFRIAGRRSEILLRRFDNFVSVFLRDGFTLDQTVEIWITVQNFLRRSDLHRAEATGMASAWSDLQADIAESEEGQYSALEVLLETPCPEMNALYLQITNILIDGISARYGVD